jgi:hypothetical protein
MNVFGAIIEHRINDVLFKPMNSISLSLFLSLSLSLSKISFFLNKC